jgi:nucleotide-binding universal stress UspA family protein
MALQQGSNEMKANVFRSKNRIGIEEVAKPRAEIAWYSVKGESTYQNAARRLQNVVPPEVHLWCTVKTAVSEGQPYREILNYAERNGIDLISVGAHGAGFGMRALFGSNVDRVLRQALCPVLVARPLRPTSLSTDYTNSVVRQCEHGRA